MPAVQTIGRRWLGRDRTRVLCIAILAAMGVVLVWSRLANIGTSFWSDEAHSAYYFAGAGPRAIFFREYVPNNHALYNLLSWITTGALGRSEAASRFWSVVPGIAAIAIAGIWAWRRLGMIAAATIVVLATVSPVQWALTTQARGYGLALLAGTLMLIGAVRACDRGETRDIALFAAAALVGIWTLPVFALPAIAQAAVLIWDRRVRRRALIAVGIVAVASLLFYAPMLSDIVANSDQEFGARLAVVSVVTGVYHHLAAPTVGSALPTDPRGLVNETGTFVVVVGLATIAVVRLVRRREHAVLANLLVPVFGTYFALVVGRFYVQPRFASYLLIHVVVVLGIGAQAIWDAFRDAIPVRAVAAVLLVAVAVVGTARITHLVEQQADLPWENYRFIAYVADASGVKKVLTNSTHPVPFYYYLGRDRVVWMRQPDMNRREFCKVKQRFIFVNDTYHRDPVSLRCLQRRGPQVLRVPQQTDPPIRRPGRLTIYIVPADDDPPGAQQPRGRAQRNAASSRAAG
jgi:hypothetical protein